MRNKLIVFLSCLFLGLAGIVCASVITQERTITPIVQKAKGGLQTGPALLSGHSETITGFMMTSGGTAQQCGIIDASSVTASSQAANTVFEASTAANTGTYIDFTNRPIQTNNGILAGCSRSDGTFIVYTEQ